LLDIPFYLSQFDDPVFAIPPKIMICYLLRPGFDQPDNIRREILLGLNVPSGLFNIEIPYIPFCLAKSKPCAKVWAMGII